MLLWIGVALLALIVLAELVLLALASLGVIDRKWRRPLGYVLLGMVSFVYFLFLGFPFDRILASAAVAPKLEQFQRQNGMKVEIGSVRGGWLFDVVASDVKITAVNPIRRAGAPADQQDPPVLKIDRLSVRLSPLALLGLRLGAHVDAALYGGHVSGTIASGRTTTVIDLGVKNVELAKYSALSDKWQVNLGGQVTGDVDLLLDQADGTKSSGRIDLTIKNAMINESNPMGIQQIPRTTFERGAGAVIVVKDGKAELKDVGLHGDDLDVALDGTIDLNKVLVYSQLNTHATIKASDGFKQKVSLLDAFLGPGKGSDGAYHYAIGGSFSRFGMPRPEPQAHR